MTKAEMLLKKTRGATMVEYALLIIVIMVLAAIAYKQLGSAVSSSADKAKDKLNGQ